MVRKVFRFLYRETRTLHQAAYLLGLFAVLSQVLAFLRDRLLAHLFGASGELDIYYAAFRIPDFIFVTIASVVSISVLVPFIIEKEKVSREEVKKFVDDVFSLFSLLIIITAAVAFMIMPFLSKILFKGFSEQSLGEVIYISRLLLISPLALGLSNLFGSITQAYNRFTIYAFAPLLYNAGIIMGIITLGPTFGVLGVAMGVAVGAVMHAGVQVPFVIKSGLLPALSVKPDLGSLKRVIILSMPRTLALSINQLALIFLVSLASLMATGSISILSFSFNLQSVPLSIIGVSYSLAAFPTLSRHFRDENLEGFVGQIATTARHIIFWSLPAAALFIVLRAQIVRVLLGTGEFDWNDTRLVAASVALFVISTVFQSLLLLFMRGFYAAGRTMKPLVINVLSAIALILMSYGLVKLFYASPEFSYFVGSLLKVEDIPNTVVLMLPLGFALGTILNGVWHWIAFEREFSRGLMGVSFSREVLRTLFEAFSTAVIMGAGAYVGLNILALLIDTSSLVGIFLQGLLSGMTGIAVGVVVLHLLKSRELKEVWTAIHSKFWKTKVIATDPEIV